MPGVGLVLDRILHHGDARQAGPVERGVIAAAARSADRRRGAQHPEVRQGRDRLAQHGGRLGRTEHRQAARATGAVVDVEVAGKRLEGGFRLLGSAEVLAHVGLRTEQALLLAAPQRDADRPPRLDADGRQDARRLHHHGAADGVVGCTGAGVPRVEMAAEHHDLVRLVGAGNLRDGVVGGAPLRMQAVDDVELQLDAAGRRARRARGAPRRSSRPAVQQTPDAPVVLVAHDDGRRRLGGVIAAAVEGADLAVVARRIVDANGSGVGDEELVQQIVGLRRRQRTVLRLVRAGRLCVGLVLRPLRPRPAAARRRQLRGRQLVHDVGILAPQRGLVERDRHLARRPDEHHRPLQARLQLVQEHRQLGAADALRQHDAQRRTADHARRARCPAERLDDERIGDRRDDVRRHAFVRPAAAGEVPRLETAVLHAPGVHLLDGPFARRLELWRSGQPRRVHIREDVHGVHDARVARAFLADLPQDVVIDALLGCGNRQTGRHYRQAHSERQSAPQLSHDYLVVARRYPATPRVEQCSNARRARSSGRGAPFVFSVSGFGCAVRRREPRGASRGPGTDAKPGTGALERR